MSPHRHPAAVAAAQARKQAAHDLADAAFRTLTESLPRDQRTRRLAYERLTRLAGAQIANDHGEGALHSALTGAVVAGAPAYEGRGARTEAEAVFSNWREG